MKYKKYWPLLLFGLLVICLVWAFQATTDGLRLVFTTLLTLTGLQAQQLEVSKNQKYLVSKDGKPFFWLEDTAWELFHPLNQEEADQYL